MVRSFAPLKNFWGSNHIIGTAEPKFVKFCTQVGYINSNNRMTYHPQKGRGYSHVTVLKCCHLPRCSASRGFVSDSWATCNNFWQKCYIEIKHFPMSLINTSAVPGKTQKRGKHIFSFHSPRVGLGQSLYLIPSFPHLLLYLLVSFTFPFSLSYSLRLFYCFSISSHSTRIPPLRFQAGCHRRRLNLALFFVLYVFLIKDACLFLSCLI